MSSSFLRWFKAWWKGEESRGPLDQKAVASKNEALARLLADDDLSWLNPPRDVHSVKAWDQYWSDQVNHGLGPGLFDMCCREEELIVAMRRRGFTRVLCAGNGISQEPRALSTAGFNVTAMDSSPAAMHFAQAFDFGPGALERYYPPELSAQGGSLDFVVGDLRDESVCPGPFDVVIERCTLQLFPPDERARALDALAHRMRSDGIFVSHCHSGCWRPGQPREHLFEDLFRQKGWIIENGYEELLSEGRVAWLSLSTG